MITLGVPNLAPNFGFNHRFTVFSTAWDINDKDGHWTNFEDLVLEILEVLMVVWVSFGKSSWSSL